MMTSRGYVPRARATARRVEGVSEMASTRARARSSPRCSSTSWRPTSPHDVQGPVGVVGGDDREALLEDEPRAEIGGPSPGHRQVVDRLVDGEAPDIAAGEEQRGHDVAVRRERQARARERDDGAVVSRGECRVRERGQEELFDQPAHEPAAAPVGELDGGVGSSVAGQLRTKPSVVTAGRPGGSGSMRRRRPRTRPWWPRAGTPACSACRRPGTRGASGAPGGWPPHTSMRVHGRVVTARIASW